VDGEWQVRVNDDGSPPLRISRKYREMLQHSDQITNEEYDFIKKKFQSAIWLIRNIEQRRRTLYRVTRAIMEHQAGFLEEGLTALKPLKLRDIADELGIHEATVCRVVNKKYVQTPRGLFELKYFFSTGLDTSGSEDMSAKSVMELIRSMIEDEDPKRPLSDQKITEMLHRDHNLNIARRTVAKYREKMGILPTSKRKRV
jgi:RNA polymerase sigma-54 factor